MFKQSRPALRFSPQVLLALSLLWYVGTLPAQARQASPDPLDQLVQFAAQQTATVPLTTWRFLQPDREGGERPDLDDSMWQTVASGHSWNGENTNVWFRTRYTVPTTVNGGDTTGAELTLLVGMDDDAEIYVDGKKLDRTHWDDGHVMLAEHARPGQTFLIAVRGINGVGPGQLHFGRIVYDFLGPIQPVFRRYVSEAQFIQQAAAQTGRTSDRTQFLQTLRRSKSQVDLAALRQRDFVKALAALTIARKTLLTLAPLTRQYDVYYIGHAHIDMNWLWTWPETIDVCHRTWDSAMNLMDRFSDFGFVQSQPGAYLPIQQQFPAQFARMQAKSAQKQWNVVGGFWDESDTNLPSGEGLARSLFLGQRYFKTHFGQYSTTGWLPDSFGHSWQLPQLFQLAGIHSFYHQRGGDGSRFSWWQAPDGSRVLKANTDQYNEPVLQEQLVRPFTHERQYGLKEAVVIYGVGDHGGGPTRDMILAGKEMQNDPLFPRVHFVTADAYFDHLYAQKRQVADLPVVVSDLQYVAVGCYTTHADIKKAVRASENNLYTAEVLSSLASITAGAPYPTADFSEAWRPTVFAQFHDIMCGTAIHSTYDWMHEQLAPAFAFEQAQTDRALQVLTATVNTQGAKAGETPVVVWNALGVPRSEVVRVHVPDATSLNQVRDTNGLATGAQRIDGQTIAFSARVPAFGSATYFLGSRSTSDATPQTSELALLRETADTIILDNGVLTATIAKATGLITSLTTQGAERKVQELIAPGQAANVLQVLGDNANAWDINYTGERHELTTGAEVQVVQNGPVCGVVRVRHTFGKSTFIQDITINKDLARLDIPTTVEWHEHGQLLKVAFPLNMAAPQARVSIPYGSIDRPTNGQENPGQKWMEVTEIRRSPVSDASPLDLAALRNHRSAGNFDGEGRGYPPALMPSAGVHRYGVAGIPFALAAPGEKDNIACEGQTIPLSARVQGNTLFLLGAAAPSSQTGTLTLRRANGTQESVVFHLGDWVVGGAPGNESALRLDYQRSPSGAPATSSKPSLWIAAVPIPAGSSPVTAVVLPRNSRIHLFAMTLGKAAPPTSLYGLTVLNDCKYGSDTDGNIFRLTLLRSPHDPDPNPDEGTHTFTYSLLPHLGDWRTAGAEFAGLALNIPLRAVVTDAHSGKLSTELPTLAVAPSSLTVGAFKHAEDGPGYIVRIFESQGKDTVARVDLSRFGKRIKVEETDLLERPIRKRTITVDDQGIVTFPVGHDQIITLHITGLPEPQPQLGGRQSARGILFAEGRDNLVPEIPGAIDGWRGSEGSSMLLCRLSSDGPVLENTSIHPGSCLLILNSNAR